MPMARWAEFAAAEPAMAAHLRAQLQDIPIAFIATVRRDGSPRMHPFCPIFAGDGMYIADAGSGRAAPSPKRWDLQNDGRYALHALPGEQDAEFYVTGRARRVADTDEFSSVVRGAGHTVHAEDWVFELGVDLGMTARWENFAQPDTYAVRKVWRAK
jgi:hypothetical protein